MYPHLHPQFVNQYPHLWASTGSSAVKNLTAKCRRPEFHPWVRKIPQRRKWQPTPVYLPRKSHRERSLGGYSPWSHKRVRHDLVTKQQHASCTAQPSKLLYPKNSKELYSNKTSWLYTSGMHISFAGNYQLSSLFVK